MFRFKTEEEFKADGNWDNRYGLPDGWVKAMNRYLGKNIPKEYHDYCERGEGFRYDACIFKAHNYVAIQSETETKSGFIIHKVKEFKM